MSVLQTQSYTALSGKLSHADLSLTKLSLTKLSRIELSLTRHKKYNEFE